MTIDVTTFQNEFRLLNDLDFSNYTWVCDPSNKLKWEGTLDGQAENIRAGVEVGGMTSRKLVEIGEEALVDKYNNTIK